MAAIDPESELLIFQLLSDDLDAESSAEDWEDEMIQFDHTAVTDPEPEPVHSPVDPSCDLDISYIAQIARDRALAQRLAAAEQKSRLDFEFARRLQDQGMNATDACDADRY
jgi:hypothetical protein